MGDQRVALLLLRVGGGPIGPPTIFEESNRYECSTGRFANTGE